MDQAEQLRNLIKMNNLMPERTARVITVTSGKGGVGKSSVAVNLAVQMNRAGKRVIIFDADFGLANVEVMFGAIPRYNLGDMIYRGMGITEIITKGPMDIGFVSGGSGIVGLSRMTREQISFIIRNMDELDSLADVIIIDTGAGIADSVLEFVMASSEVLLVITPEPSSLTDSYSLLKALNSSSGYVRGETAIKVISNRASGQEEGLSMYKKLETVVDKFLDMDIGFLGVIPQDKNVEKAIIQQKPVSMYIPNARASKAFGQIAEALLNDLETEGQPGRDKGMARLFSRFLNRNKD